MPERAYPKAKFQSDKYKVFPFQCSVKYESTRVKFYLGKLYGAQYVYTY
jgi:hypothetical protein